MVVCCCTLRFILKLNSASAAFTFGRGGILSENRKDGKVTVHSAKNTTKFDSTVGPYANSTDQMNGGRSDCFSGLGWKGCKCIDVCVYEIMKHLLCLLAD